MHSDTPVLRVFPDLRTFSRAAAGFVAERVTRAVASRGVASLVLSGGATPAPVFSELAFVPGRIDWTRVHFFWSDERCVLPDHPDSNYKLAFDNLLSRVQVPEANVHRIRGEDGPDRAAALYEHELSGFSGAVLPVFDVMLLGVGDDGHTASLFPGSALLRERTRLALPVHIEAPGVSRVTLSLPLLNNAEHVLFLVTGRSKASVVHEIVEDGNPKDFPAGLVRPMHGSLTWMLDIEAARALTGLYDATGKKVKTG